MALIFVQAITEELHYPGWTLIIAALLSVASLIPIFIGKIIWDNPVFCSLTTQPSPFL